MKKNEVIKQLRDKFSIYNPSLEFYARIIEEYIKEYDLETSRNLAEEDIKIKIAEEWEAGKKEWLIDFVNETCQVKMDQSYNSRYLTFILRLLEKYSIQLDNQSLLYILRRCPNFNGILDSYSIAKEGIHNINLALRILIRQYQNLNARGYKSASVMPIPLLEEEVKNCKNMLQCHQNNNEEGFYWYRNQVIEGLQFLVEAVAKNYVGQGIDFRVLVNEANVYLLENIIQIAKPTKSPFRTKVANCLKKLFEQTIKKSSYPDISLNTMKDTSGEYALEDYIYAQEVKEALEQEICYLRSVEIQTIILRYGIYFEESPLVAEPLSGEMIAQMYNTTHQGIRWREKNALTKLRANKRLRQVTDAPQMRTRKKKKS